MATDKSEPRVGLIFGIGISAIVILLSLRAMLVSYFDNITSAEEVRKIGHVVPEALINLRTDEKARLTTGPLPVDKAMQDIIAHGRNSASPDIMPSASRDLGPLEGWTKMPEAVPPTMAAPPASSESVDAGTPPATSASVDNGTHKPPAGGSTKKQNKKQP